MPRIIGRFEIFMTSKKISYDLEFPIPQSFLVRHINRRPTIYSIKFS
jgi:hypothetical protein